MKTKTPEATTGEPTGARKASAPVALVLVLALFVVAVIALIQVFSLFGPTTEAAALFPFHLAFFVFPAWVLLRLLPRGVVPEWLWPHPMRAMAVGILLLLVVVPLTIDGVQTDVPSTNGKFTTVLLLAGPMSIVGVIGFLVATTRVRQGAGTDPVLSESVVFRAWLRTVLGMLGGAGAAILLFTAFVLIGKPFARGASVRLDLAAWFPIAAILVIASTFAVAWASGYVYSGMLRVGHARSRNRRVTDAKALKGRLDDHYSLRRVGDATFRSLRERLTQEIEGFVPGEARFLRSREGIVRVGLLAVLLIIAGTGLAFTVGILDRSIETAVDYREDRRDIAPYGTCDWCESEEDWKRFLAYPRTVQALYPLVMVATVLLTAHSAIVLPLLVNEMRHARTEMKAFWDERRVFEERMLAEVRASSA